LFAASIALFVSLACTDATRPFASDASLRNSSAVSRIRTDFAASSAAFLAPKACTHAIQLKTTPAMLAIVPTMVNNQFQAPAVIQASFAQY
jgi:hypothetical protein